MNRLIIGAMAALFLGCNSNNTNTVAAPAAQTEVSRAEMYYNGDIVTMEGDSAVYIEAVVVKDGKILYAGSKNEGMKQAGEGHQMVDLEGKFMSPGFIDAHGHAFGAGFQKIAANILPPPDGPVSDIGTLIKTMQQWYVDLEKQGKAPKVIVGFGYDDSQLKERRHPNATDLDKISNTIPVVLMHQSGHLQVLNHAALEAVGFNSKSIDPQGGVIRRARDGKTPDGVLEETAGAIVMMKLFSKFDSSLNVLMCKAGAQAYKEFGFTTLQEGAASPSMVSSWQALASSGELDVDIAAYPVLVAAKDLMAKEGVSSTYKNHFRIAGIKITQDGSPQGKTAYLSKPYKVPPAGQPGNYRGYPAFPRQSQLDSLVELAFEKNWQVLMHCNGDAAGDMMITSVRHATDKLGAKDRRPVMIHAQTSRFAQLDSMKILGIIPSFFSMHTFYWGDWHRDETLGPERASRISPAQTAYKKGLIFTEHHDAPVGLPSSLMIMHTAVNRTSRTNAVIGEAEKLTPYQALLSLTRYSAYQYFEESSKGTITAGKLADLVILNKNPLKIDPKEIINIKVVETIKEGKTVYKKS
jgi:predicted amidohydrolase YtcJ